MFIDSSVLVAIVSGEDDAREFTQILQEMPGCVTSALVILESTMRLATKQQDTPAYMLEEIENLIREAEMDIMPIEAHHARLAVEAFARFGKGRGHPAQLNLADCLSYACAKSRDVPLLYKGDDFSRTDLAWTGGA